MFGRRNIAALVAEFMGTATLTLLVLAVQRSTIGVPFFVALAAGLAVIIMSFALASTSGAYFNPAITIGMWTARKISSLKAVLYIATQFLGGWAAYALYHYYSHAPLQAVGGHFTGRILVAEAVGTGIFAFGLAGVVYQKFSAATAAAVAGLALTLGMIAASPASIGLLNPAVALGVRAWVWGTYILGPILGAVIGINLYVLLFAEPEMIIASNSAAKVTPVNKVPIARVVKPVSTKKTKTAKKKATAKKKK